MNRYQFEQILQKMTRRYGQIAPGEEDTYDPIFIPIYTNLLSVHRKYPDSNSQRAKEAYLLALHRIEGYLTGTQPDVQKFENSANLRLRDAILSAFDPFTNPEVRQIVEAMGATDLENRDDLATYFEDYAKCIVRLYKSAEIWIKRLGSDGMFVELESWLGPAVKADEKMQICVRGGSRTQTFTAKDEQEMMDIIRRNQL